MENEVFEHDYLTERLEEMIRFYSVMAYRNKHRYYLMSTTISFAGALVSIVNSLRISEPLSG